MLESKLGKIVIIFQWVSAATAIETRETVIRTETVEHSIIGMLATIYTYSYTFEDLTEIMLNIS